MNLFDARDHAKLTTLFAPDYSGYKPTVAEAPNGDGKVDLDKRYLHVALKYNPPEWARYFLSRAHFEACRIAEAMGVPAAYYPRVENGTLRVLEYPPGAGSAEHEDFDLFTVHCYRSTPDDFVRTRAVDERAETLNHGVHIGQIGALVGLGKATPHAVMAREYSQQAIVYFAMPANGAVLPSGQTVGEWLVERYSRSRVCR